MACITVSVPVLSFTGGDWASWPTGWGWSRRPQRSFWPQWRSRSSWSCWREGESLGWRHPGGCYSKTHCFGAFLWCVDRVAPSMGHKGWFWGRGMKRRGRSFVWRLACTWFNRSTRGVPEEMELLQWCDLGASRCCSLWGYLLGCKVLVEKEEEKKKRPGREITYVS